MKPLEIAAQVGKHFEENNVRWMRVKYDENKEGKVSQSTLNMVSSDLDPEWASILGIVWGAAFVLIIWMGVVGARI
jgi:hypothetical protein